MAWRESRGVAAVLCLGLVCAYAAAAHADLLITGNDGKVTFGDSGAQFGPPGGDSVSIVDVGADPESPSLVVDLKLMNSVFGPPTNVVISEDQSLALVANAMAWTQDGDAWKPAPNNQLHVIDLTVDPPAHIDTVDVGAQPSGLAINRAGNLALAALRADGAVGIISIAGKSVSYLGAVEVGEQAAAVAFAPDGTRALVAKFAEHKIGVLDIDGTTVTYDAANDMPVGLWPYNVKITPDGGLALTADNGNRGQSDGHVDTVSVIDLDARPPRVIDRIVVGDAPEGLAISPNGDVAVAVLLRGSAGIPADTWYYNATGSVVVLKIDGKTVTRGDEIDVGGLPEGVVFNRDGSYLYVGNYTDSDLSILKVDGTTVVDTGKRFALPGQPGSVGNSVP